MPECCVVSHSITIMLPRPLLLQRRLVSCTISPRSFGNLAFNSCRTLKLKHGPSRVVTPSLLPCRHFTLSLVRRSVAASATTNASATTPEPTTTTTPKENKDAETDDNVYNKLYVGPLESTFRRLKIFSLTSLALSTTLAPFIFMIESNLPPTARMALAAIAITTSATSTGMVAWCGKPYVTQLRYIRPEENGGAEGMEMTTMSLLMKPRITTVSVERIPISSQSPREDLSW